jgi:hypothetical protein
VSSVQGAQQKSKLSFTLDPDFTQTEHDALLNDVNRIQSLEIHEVPGSYFEKIFGSTENAGVIQYLSERIHYVLPHQIKLSSRLTQDSSPIFTYATNIGTMLWFDALNKAPNPYAIRVGNLSVPVTSSRVGIIQLGLGYILKSSGSVASSQIQRISTLIHEARHSDCTGGINASDLELLWADEDPEKSNCGHLHVRCPEGHAYDGAYACDGEAWGAHSISAIYLAGIVKHCQNCTAEEKSLAATIYADSLGRVIPRDDMLAGKLGDPDMSSSTVVHPSDDHSPFSLMAL